MDFPDHVGLVEDDPFTLRIMQASFLKQRKCRVSTWKNVAEAMAGIPADPPGLLLVDANLGEEKGTDLLSMMQDFPDLPPIEIIFVTGESALDWTEFRQFGVIGLLCKPFNPVSLPDLVDKIRRNADG